LGINTTKLPQTPEEFEKVQESLRNPKSGISLEIKVDETNNAEKQVFNGRNLVDWILRNYHIQQRPDAIEIAKYFKDKKLFMPFANPMSEAPFNDGSKDFYCFYEDEFDNYLSSIASNQFHSVHKLIIGPLGVRTTGLHPILGAKIISWMLRSFVDIKSRTEASRLLAYLTRKGFIKEHESLPDHYWVVKSLNTFDEIPLEICSICAQFTSLLSVGPKITLSCGHTFHDSCLMSLPSYEMGRCSGCNTETSKITATSELDLVLPFITKILGSSNYAFKSQIDKFSLEFNKKFELEQGKDKAIIEKDVTEKLHEALGELSIFISEMSNSILADLRLLEVQEHGQEKCILTLKKFIIPGLYDSLFTLYKSVNYSKDEILSQKLLFLKQSKVSMKALGVMEKFCLIPSDNLNSSNPSLPMTPKKNQFETSQDDITKTNKEVYFQSLPYSVALTEFDRLGDYTDVYDKLNCLVLTLHYISNAITTYWKQKKQFNVNELTLCTDDLVAIFSYIVIHTQSPNLYSEYKFIDDFIDEFAVTAEPGYCVTTIGAVLNYLIDIDVTKLLAEGADEK
jgi:hypothetical protein